MSRAFDVALGVGIIVAVWSWMIVSIGTVPHGAFGVLLVISKVVIACLATGPVYREYLR